MGDLAELVEQQFEFFSGKIIGDPLVHQREIGHAEIGQVRIVAAAGSDADEFSFAGLQRLGKMIGLVIKLAGNGEYLVSLVSSLITICLLFSTMETVRLGNSGLLRDLIHGHFIH